MIENNQMCYTICCQLFCLPHDQSVGVDKNVTCIVDLRGQGPGVFIKIYSKSTKSRKLPKKPGGTFSKPHNFGLKASIKNLGSQSLHFDPRKIS